MCGRFDQSDTARHYAAAFGWADAVYENERQRVNVSPGMQVPLFHIADDERRIDDTFWSYRAGWVMKREPAPGKRRLPIAINAKLEKISGSYWKPLLTRGRAVVAASGWYEGRERKAPSSLGIFIGRIGSRSSCSRWRTSGRRATGPRKPASRW